jgi:oligopeptide/dipeptide ABC transporter ATP-binding protein
MDNMSDTTMTATQSVSSVPSVIEARGLHKIFYSSLGAFGGHAKLRAVDGVDFTVAPNKVFSLVGESGCGKSTVARLLVRLIEPTSGEVFHRGNNVFKMKPNELKAFRRDVQIVFQDPFASLNPRRTVYETLSEPMVIHSLASGKVELRDRVTELLKTVGLVDVMDRYPHEFSGGQRQRICIARALSVGPQVIVADEPLSALDVSIQAQILNLLIELKETTGLAFVFISHDLRVVRYLSDEVGVMYLGKIVEQAPAVELFDAPLHPYTEVLLNAAPQLVPGRQKEPPLQGEVPSPLNIPSGCPFHPRCPKVFEPCSRIVPELKGDGGLNGRIVACHLHNAY